MAHPEPNQLEEAWYYTRHILDDFVLVADDYYPTPMTAERAEGARRLLSSLRLDTLDEERAAAARRLLAALQRRDLDDIFAALLSDLHG